MKVSVLTLLDTLLIGGAEHMAVAISNSLYRIGVPVHFCSMRRSGPMSERLLPQISFTVLHKKSVADFKSLMALRRLILENRINVVHVHNYSVMSLLLARFFPFPLLGFRIVWHDHSGGNAERPLWAVLLASWLVDTIIVVDKESQVLFQRFLLDKRKVRLLPNYAQLRITGNLPELPGRPGLRVVHVGTVYPLKNQAMLLDVFSLIVQQIPEAHLLFVGPQRDAVYYELLVQRVRELGLEQNVTFLGERNDVQDILKQSEVGVLCSLSEGTPLSLLEYGLVGLPVVVTDVGDCARVVKNNLSGYVVPVQDVSAFASALLNLLKTPDLRKRMGKALQADVQEGYAEQGYIKQLLSIYQEERSMHG